MGYLERLSARMDSFAVTLTDVVAVLERPQRTQAGLGTPDSAMISITGSVARGAPSAPVVVEFTDYHCPYCRRHFTETVPQLKSNHVGRGKIRYVVRDLPPPVHEAALPAAVAELGNPLFVDIARSLNLDLGAFERCRPDKEATAAVAADRTAAREAGLTGTRSFIVGRLEEDTLLREIAIRGAQSFSAFESAIESALMINSPPSETASTSGR